MRFPLLLGAVVLVAACAPEVPDSAAGVGFDDYDDFRDQRAADLDGRPSPVPSGPVIASETAGNITLPASSATADTRNRGISDEQSFDAVADRETIESDAERLARNREAYVLIAPTALPRRPSDGRPNIVAFALATDNPVGTPLYERSATSQTRYRRACARFTSPDLAQEEFLHRGGPERDRLGLDPDGDGYACAWNPAPFRAAVRG